MDFDPKHDLSLNLPLSFPGDDDEAGPAEAGARRYYQQQQQQQRYSPVPRSRAEGKAPEPAPPQPTFTVYIRVPAPRNGFVDPPDIDWSREKDDALWKILSGVSRNNIDWQDLYGHFTSPLWNQASPLILAHRFNATVEFLVIQANILTERQVSQVRAQTRKVATLGARDSPVHSPLLPPGERPPSVAGAAASRIAAVRAATPTLTSEALGRTLSAGGMTNAAARPAAGGSSSNSRGGSRRQSEAVEGAAATSSPAAKVLAAPVDGHLQRVRTRFAAAAADAARSPTPDDQRAAAQQASGRRRPHNHHHHNRYDSEDVDPLSPVATSSQLSSESDSDSDSSTPSQPVMSRIFKRPPGYPHQDDFDARSSTDTARASGRAAARFGGAGGLGIISRDSAGSDGGDESETQPAFLPFKSPTLADTISGRPVLRMQKSLSPSSSSASASPTAKTFKSAAAAAAAANARGAGQTGAASASAASSPAAAARLHPSRLPVTRSSSSTLHHNRNLSAGQSPGSRRHPGYSREGSETGTTPSMGSSFSDLDDVSLTQSVLDEALASRVEDTISTRSDTQSSSTNMATSSSTMSRRFR